MLSTTLVAPEKFPIEAPQSENSQEQEKHQFSERTYLTGS